MGEAYSDNVNPQPSGQAISGLLITPRVSVSEIYTDNVNLRPSGQANSDLLTRLRPGFDLYANSARLTGSLSYTLDAVLSSFGSGRNNLFHDLDATGNAELIKQHLFVDASARSTQQAIDLLRPVGIDNTTATNNLTEVTFLSVSPYLTNHFGSFADSTLRYAHDRVYGGGGTLSDSYTNRVDAQLASGDLFGPLFWALDASRRRTIQSRNSDSDTFNQGSGQLGSGTFNQGSGQLGYRLSPHWSVSATGGYEDNNYNTFRNTQDGAFWDVGVHWVPNQRMNLEAHYGHRFFGTTGSLNLSYRRRTTLWQASYSESIASQQDLVRTNAGTVVTFSCPPSDQSCTPASVFIPQNVGTGLTSFCPPSALNCAEQVVFRPQTANDFFLLRQAVASVTAFSPRHSVTLAYSMLRETFESDGAQARQQGVTLGWTWRVTSNANLMASSGWSQNEPQRTNRKDNLWHVLVGISRDLSPNAEASLRYRHQSRLSSESAVEYDENGVTAEISMQF